VGRGRDAAQVAAFSPPPPSLLHSAVLKTGKYFITGNSIIVKQ